MSFIPDREFTFADDLWDGFDAAKAEGKRTLQLLKDMSQYMKDRAVQEENYFKGLQKLNRGAAKLVVPGSLGKQFHDLRINAERYAQQHYEFSLRIVADITNKLDALRDQHTREQKSHVSSGNQLVKDIDSSRQSAYKARERYRLSNVKLEGIQGDLQRLAGAPPDPSTTKQLDKLNTKLVQQLKEKENCNNAFQQAVANLHLTRQRYNQGMRVVLSNMQRSITQRNEALCASFVAYTTMQDTNMAVIKDSSSEAKQISEKIDPKKDVEDFIRNNITHERPTDEMKYTRIDSKYDLVAVSQREQAEEDAKEVTPTLISEWAADYPHLQVFLNLKAMLADNEICDAFLKFLETEYCQESLLFYRAVEVLRQSGAAGADLLKGIHEIKDTYLTPGKEFEVNVETAVRKKVDTVLSSESFQSDPNLDIFDESKAIVFQLMQDNSYKRFLNSTPSREVIKHRKQHGGPPPATPASGSSSPGPSGSPGAGTGRASAGDNGASGSTPGKRAHKRQVSSMFTSDDGASRGSPVESDSSRTPRGSDATADTKAGTGASSPPIVTTSPPTSGTPAGRPGGGGRPQPAERVAQSTGADGTTDGKGAGTGTGADSDEGARPDRAVSSPAGAGQGSGGGSNSLVPPEQSGARRLTHEANSTFADW